MAAKSSNLNIELKKLIKELRSKLTYAQERMYREHPEIMLESVFASYKQFCEGQGIDYKTTAMYQEEQKFHQFQNQLQASRKKWAYLDTPLGIELYNMLLHNVREREMISRKTFYSLWDFECLKPSGFKAFMEMYLFGDQPSPELTPKMVDEFIRLHTYYEQFYSLQAFDQLSYKEQLLFYARHIAGRLTDKQEQFVSQFIDEHDHLPIFYLITAFYENTDIKSCIAARDYHGLCGGERKSLEQIQSELGVCRSYAHHKIRRGFPDGLFHVDIPLSCWEPYRELFAKLPLLTADNCHYEQIKEEEYLYMNVNEFMVAVIMRVPWINMVFSPKRGDDRLWGVGDCALRLFRFWQFFADVRQEQIRKERPKTVTFDLNRICKGKKYQMDPRKPLPTSEEAAMLISVIKPTLKEMLGIETKGNKIIFPAKK